MQDYKSSEVREYLRVHSGTTCTVKPALAAIWIRRSPPQCGQLGKVPKFEPIVSILYCSSTAVTCVMRNAVTLLHPKRAIARYKALPITATECVRALCTCARVLCTCAHAFNILESKMNIQNDETTMYFTILKVLRSLLHGTYLNQSCSVSQEPL